MTSRQAHTGSPAVLNTKVMLIYLSSTLFRTNPAVRFATRYGVPEKVWTEAWRRYVFLDYTKSDIRDFIWMKTSMRLTLQSIDRWIFRSIIYSKARPAIEKGARVVKSDYFGEYEMRLVEELAKDVKSHKNTRNFV